MKKLLLAAFALAMVGSLNVSADSASDCRRRRESEVATAIQQALNDGDKFLTQLQNTYTNDRSLYGMTDYGEASDFADALAAAIHRGCLRTYTNNLDKGSNSASRFTNCKSWAEQRGYKVWDICGGNGGEYKLDRLK